MQTPSKHNKLVACLPDAHIPLQHMNTYFLPSLDLSLALFPLNEICKQSPLHFSSLLTF